MEVRLIIMGNDSGTEEQVIFTEDFENEGSYFCPPDLTVRYDEIILAEIPSTFPTEFNLRRK